MAAAWAEEAWAVAADPSCIRLVRHEDRDTHEREVPYPDEE